ncbi:MAG: SpvB/TcaC N-terminal domain-containing protein [Patescibacteria group bacterium]|nr:VCBS repeat-containing protein [Patescibacteria group bacterium]
MKKIIASIVIATLITPLVLAEEPIQGEVPLQVEEGIQVEMPSEDIEAPPEMEAEPDQQEANGDDFEPFLDYAAEGVSGLSFGAYETDISTGAATYNYPIYLPPGRSGFQPQVAISYNNQGASSDSFAGYGWDLFTGGSISRTQEYGVFDIYSTNEFNLNMPGFSGKLLPVNLVDFEHGEYGLQIEEAFYKYEFLADDSWVVTDQSGVRYTFGVLADSRQDDPNDSSRIFEWELTEVRDLQGNFVRFEYFKDQGRIYPQAIYYTGFDQSDGPIEVVFEWDFRDDWTKWYDKGFEVRTDYLLFGIEVLLEGASVRNYDLSYTVGDNGKRAMLSSVMESAGGITLPETSFSYSKNDGDYDFSYSGIYADISDGSNFVDVNGDGFPDQTPFHDDGIYPYIYSRLNDSDGLSFWTEVFEAHYSRGGLNDTPEDAGHYLDMNGDASPEFIVMYDSPYIYDGCVYRNYGEGLTGVYDSGCSEGTISRGSRGYRFGDFDGDSLLDLFTGDAVSADWTEPGDSIYLNNGHYDFSDSGYDSVLSFSWGAYGYPNYYRGQDTGARLVDINGDGLTDIVQGYADLRYYNRADDNEYPEWSYYLNDGNGGFSLDSDFVLEFQSELYFAGMQYSSPNYEDGSYYSSSQEMCYADFNGDGIVDLLRNGEAYVWDGVDMWTVASVPAQDFDAWCGGIQYAGTNISYGTNDLNGDGLIDFFESWEDIAGPRGAYFNTEGKPDLLTGIITSEGAEIEIDYESALQGDNPELPFALYTVFEVTTYDGMGGAVTTSYDYSGGSYVKYFGADRASFGRFAEVSVSELGRETIYYFESGCSEDELCSSGLESGMVMHIDGEGWYVVDGNYFREVTANIVDAGLCQNVSCQNGFSVYESEILDLLPIGEVWDDLGDDFMYEVTYENHALKGKPLGVEVYDDLGNLYSRSVFGWEVSDLGEGRYFPHMDLSLEFSFEGEVSAREKAVSYVYNNDYGLLSQEINWGEVEADEGSFEIVDYLLGDEIYTYYSYAANEADFVFAQAEVLAQDGDGATLADMRCFYDGYEVLGDIGDGLLTRESVLLDDGSLLFSEYEYDQYGNRVLIRDPRGFETNFTYDENGFYPETITNAMGHNLELEINYLNGESAREVDFNGYEYVYNYDSFGRILEIWGPSVDGLSSVLHVSYEYDDIDMPRSVRESLSDGTIDGFNKYTYVDGLGRDVQIRVEGEVDYSVSDVTYDESGQVEFEGLPYFEAGTTYTGLNVGWPGISYEYDGLGRVVSMSTPMGDSSTDYGVLSEVFVDPLGNSSEFYYDIYGNLVEVVDTYLDSTYYEYDLLGNLVSIEDAHGNLRSFEWDLLGRLVSQEEMHDPFAANYAAWGYSYDENGNLAEQFLPDGESVSYVYDELNRTVSEDYSGNPGVEYSFEYDTSLNGVGLLASASFDGGSVSYEYNALSGVSFESKNIQGHIFDMSLENDLMGRVTSIVYPGGEEAYYSFNEGGGVESITYQGEVVISDMDYSAMGQFSEVSYGNGDIITSIYDPEQMYLLENKSAVSGSGEVLLDLSYEYDAISNILSVTKPEVQVFYEYDDLYRLISASATGNVQYEHSYDYDAIGNMIYKEGIGGMFYEGDNPHAVTSAGDYVFDYDDFGNVVSDGAAFYVYDYKGQLKWSDPGIYFYDHLGRRFCKDLGNGEISFYPSMFYEEEWLGFGEGVTRNYVFVDGVRVYVDETEIEIPLDYRSGLVSQNNGWARISFDEVFPAGADVAVFSQIQSEIHPDYSHVDLRDVDEAGFTLRLEEDRGVDLSWMNGGHIPEQIGYIVVDLNTLTSGMRGGKDACYQTVRLDNICSIEFDEPFAEGEEVVVLAQIQTEHGGHTVHVEVLSVSEDGFEMELQENIGNGTSGDWDGMHVGELVAWVVFPVIDNPFGSEAGSVLVGDDWESVSFSEVYEEVPIVFVSEISENETDVTWSDIKNVMELGFEVRVEELLAAGWDGIHADEEIVWFTIDENS